MLKIDSSKEIKPYQLFTNYKSQFNVRITLTSILIHIFENYCSKIF